MPGPSPNAGISILGRAFVPGGSLQQHRFAGCSHNEVTQQASVCVNVSATAKASSVSSLIGLETASHPAFQ